MRDFERLNYLFCDLIKSILENDRKASPNLNLDKAEKAAYQLLEMDPYNSLLQQHWSQMSWYDQSLAKKSGRRNCFPWIRIAVKLDGKHNWLPIYIGYMYWNDGEFEDALAAFTRVELDHLESDAIQFQTIKLREMALCCRLHLDESNVDFQILHHLVADYLAGNFTNPKPTEIIRTLVKSDYCMRFDTDPRLVAAEMCRLIQGIKSQNGFASELCHFQTLMESAV